MNYRRTCILLGFFLVLSSSTQAAISFGARTQIWPFLFTAVPGKEPGYSADERMKAGIAIGNLDRYGDLGATWNIVEVWQGVDGPDGFRRLDGVVAEHERREIQVALRILERPEIYDDISSGGSVAERALRDYRQWVRDIALRYDARVRYYMISNETDHDVGFNRTFYRQFRPVTVEEYGQLLDTAHEAVKSVNSGLTVVDHGISSYSLCLAVMADMASSGDLGDALTFWRGMANESPGEGERTTARLVKMLMTSDSRHRIEFARRSTAELTRHRDAFQLHHYAGPEVVPAVMSWIRQQLGDTGASQPILAAEVGYLLPAKRGKSWDGRPMNVADMARYSETDHGDSIARTITVLGGSGVNDILYWHIRFHVARARAAALYAPTEIQDEFRPSYPAQVFRNITRELSGASAVESSPGIDHADLAEYHFRGETEFSVVWALGGEMVRVPPSVRRRITHMTDTAGVEIDLGKWDGRIGTAPVFMFWQQQPVND